MQFFGLEQHREEIDAAFIVFVRRFLELDAGNAFEQLGELGQVFIPFGKNFGLMLDLVVNDGRLEIRETILMAEKM